MTQSIRYGRKRRGIKQHLSEKINDWLESIDDLGLRRKMEKDVIVTGGALASMLLGEQVNDYDVYFRTMDTAKAVAEYYLKKFTGSLPEGSRVCIAPFDEAFDPIDSEESHVVVYIPSKGVASEDGVVPRDVELYDVLESYDSDKPRYRPVFISANAITLSDKVQVILRFHGEPADIHNNYDFVRAKCSWDHHKHELTLPADALEALLSRTLHYAGSLYPIASIFRMKKFLERGWRISAGDQLKIMWQISELDLTNISVLREQLTGVDMAYMHALIRALENVKAEDLNSTYVAEIIDKIFG